MDSIEAEAEKLLNEDLCLQEDLTDLANQVSVMAAKVSQLTARVPEFRGRGLSELLERIKSLLMRALEIVDRLQREPSSVRVGTRDVPIV
jgi:hypothetical protein